MDFYNDRFSGQDELLCNFLCTKNSWSASSSLALEAPGQHLTCNICGHLLRHVANTSRLRLLMSSSTGSWLVLCYQLLLVNVSHQRSA